MSARRKEVAELLRELRKQKAQIRKTGRERWAATHPVSGATVYIPASPSDSRALKNKRADLRHTGFQA